MEAIYQDYLPSGNLEIVTAGMDWGQPYSCTSWAETFGQTFPVLDDNTGNDIYALFGIGYVPHNIVIGGDGTVIYSQSGHNLNAILGAIEEGISNLVLDADNVTADLTGESPFWIIKREKLDRLLLDESLVNVVQIIIPLLIEKIIKKMINGKLFAMTK